MARGWGRAVVAATLIVVGVLAVSIPALGADPPPVPKPDPPPKANPPPPPAPVPPPPAQPAAPPPPAPVAAPAPTPTPTVVHPTAAERRAAAKRRATRKAAVAARVRAAAATKLAHRRERAKDVLAAGNHSSSSDWGVPVLLAAFSFALVLLGIALMPARAVPWGRVSRVLEARREEFGVMGATGLVATVVFFLLVKMTK